MGKPFNLRFCSSIYWVGAGISTLTSNSDGLGPYVFHRKIEKTRPMRWEMDGNVFISRQSWHFSFIANLIKVLFRICTSTWRIDNNTSRQ